MNLIYTKKEFGGGGGGENGVKGGGGERKNGLKVGVLVEQRVIESQVPGSNCDLMCTDSKVSLWYRWGAPFRTHTRSQSTG